MKTLIWGRGVINYTPVKWPVDGVMDVQMSLLSWISCISSAKVKRSEGKCAEQWAGKQSRLRLSARRVPRRQLIFTQNNDLGAEGQLLKKQKTKKNPSASGPTWKYFPFITSLAFFFILFWIAMSLLVVLTKRRVDATFHVDRGFIRKDLFGGGDEVPAGSDVLLRVSSLQTLQVSPAPPHRRLKQQPSAAATLIFVQRENSCARGCRKRKVTWE